MFEQFIEENIERDNTHFENIENIYFRYLLFCKNKKFKPMTKTQLNNQFKNKCIGQKHRRMRNRILESGIYGVRLKLCPY